jgi:hypothetical protein
MRIVCRQLLMLGIISLAVITFFTGINWGLPTRGVDSFLFGDRTPWTGALIMQLAGPWDAGGTRGADIAMHPITNRDRSIALNDTDAKRAEIVRRFRLYSNQPDEMITFRSLARMKPGKLDLDPRLYQYGGLWIYPIGALLKLGSLLHIITLRTDLAFYLDHPEAFGRFYLVARSYSALWGLLGVFAIFVVGREWTGKFFVGATAAAVYAAMPVVINAAHEAKPHLAGTVLTLLTVWAGLRFVRTGRPRWWIIAGIFAGAAMGMVLTGYAAFAVLPAMILLRPMSWKRRIALLIGTGMIGLFVFIATNPYLPYDFLFNRAAIKSNIGNYGTFYRPGVSFSAMSNTARLLIEGMSPALACVGTIAVITYVIALCRRRATVGKHANGPRANCQQFEDRNGSAAPIARLDQTPEAQAIGLLLAAPAILVLIQFILLAQGKAAEYARFAVTLDVVIAIAAAALIEQLRMKPREKILLAVWLVGATLFYGCRYDINCFLDNRSDSSRRLAAMKISRLASQADVLAVWSEPAPYCTPPVDLFKWKIVLLPRSSDALAANTGKGVVSVRPVDELPDSRTEVLRPASPISWADKPFEINSFPAAKP